ncbi:MAG: hypothetical protein GPOALKHO_001580 [Sodalis sp.]|nr:MAG: hypothetical protein GPOALKHO_001580 [Sodalis sp.]
MLSRLENAALTLFTAFLFFSTLFCNVTKVNNLSMCSARCCW